MASPQIIDFVGFVKVIIEWVYYIPVVILS